MTESWDTLYPIQNPSNYVGDEWFIQYYIGWSLDKLIYWQLYIYFIKEGNNSPFTVMPTCTHLLQSPSIKEFIVFSRPASEPEQIEIGNISCAILGANYVW